MKREEIKNGRISVDNGYGKIYNFEIVQKILAGFNVWNIPEIGGGEYIPICEDAHPEDKQDYSVNEETLKAVKLNKEEVTILHDAASSGVRNVKSAQAALRRTAKSKMMKRKQMLAEKALPILERITE